jgi:serine/threonine protein kinase
MDHHDARRVDLHPDVSLAAPVVLPSAVPDHELLRLIGHGSYGEVWLARSVLGALRAVKVVHRSRFRDAKPYEREFSGILHVEPLSRSNEGLVDILHVGRHEPEGYFYYVMELADDVQAEVQSASDASLRISRYQPRTLSRDLKRRGPLPFEECVQLGFSLASALSHLHKNGLVHRDVKPSNILYVGGVPKLGDIGLVGETGETVSYVGTEGYIPPEGPGGPLADVFSLGKVLYEASTGRDRLDFPQLPESLGDAVSQAQLAELNEVVLRACAPDPRHRYAGAGELHADLALLHRGQSVLRQHRSERRWRHAHVAINAGALLTGLAAGILWSPLPRTRPGSVPAPPLRTQPVRLSPVELSPYFNASLTNNWLRDYEGNDLSSLPTGWRRYGAVSFDVRGLVQLSGAYTQDRRLSFPTSLDGIPVDRRCNAIHFLHGTVWKADQGETVARYVVHYADGRHEEVPLRYGDELRDWWWSAKFPLNATAATVAWVGTNTVTGAENKLCLYQLSWNNPRTGVPVRSLDFVSAGSPSCPFLIAVTTE